jgi:predicted nucleotidyltransferase
MRYLNMTNVVSLLTHAETQQRRAYELIEVLNLLDVLRPIGNPVIIGSLRTGLMVDPDIDIVVQVDGRPDIAHCFAAMSSLATNQDIVQVVFFENKLSRPFNGLFFDIACQFQGTSWQLNISVFGSDCPHRHAIEETSDALLMALTPRIKEIILCIKAERHDLFGPYIGAKSGQMAATIDLYRAVFDGDVKTYDQAVAWIAEHPSEEGFQVYRPRG